MDMKQKEQHRHMKEFEKEEVYIWYHSKGK